MGWHVYPQTVVSGSLHYVDQTSHVSNVTCSHNDIAKKLVAWHSTWISDKNDNSSLYTVTSIKRSPFFRPVIENFRWIEPLLRDHLSYKATFSWSQRSWPLNTGLTVYCRFCQHLEETTVNREKHTQVTDKLYYTN